MSHHRPKHDSEDIRSRSPTKHYVCARPKTDVLLQLAYYKPIVSYLRSSNGQKKTFGPKSTTPTARCLLIVLELHI